MDDRKYLGDSSTLFCCFFLFFEGKINKYFQTENKLKFLNKKVQ